MREVWLTCTHGEMVSRPYNIVHPIYVPKQDVLHEDVGAFEPSSLEAMSNQICEPTFVLLCENRLNIRRKASHSTYLVKDTEHWLINVVRAPAEKSLSWLPVG